MARDEGWIKVYRVLQKHWIWERPDYLKAWLYLLLKANHEDKAITLHGKTVVCKTGSVNISIKRMALDLDWSWQTCKRFLENCQADGMIRMRSSNGGTVIDIVHYSKYQGTKEEHPKAKPKKADKPKEQTQQGNGGSYEQFLKDRDAMAEAWARGETDDREG